MAQIKQYENPIDGLRTTDTGIDATLQSAKRSGAFFNQAAAAHLAVGEQHAQMVADNYNQAGSAVKDAMNVAVDYAEHQEIAHGAVGEAGLTSKLTKEWNDRVKNADPNDPTVAEKFRDEVINPELENFQKGFWTERGQKWAESRTEALRKHLDTKAAADMGSLAAAAVSANVRMTVNAASNTAMQDPSSVDFLLKQSKENIAAMVDSSPNLKGAVGQKAKIELSEKYAEQIVKAGAVGSIRKSQNPEATGAEWAQKYPQYINGAEVKQLEDAARQQLRFINMENRAAREEARRQDTEKFHQAANELELSTTRVNKDTGAVEPFSPPNLREKLTAITSMPHADPGRVAALVRRAEQVGVAVDDTTRKNTEVRSRAVQADLYSQMLDGRITSPRAFQDAYVKGDLTWEAKGQLERDFQADKSETGQPVAQRRNEYLKSHEGELDPARMVAGLKSPNGSVAIDKAGQALRKAEADLRNAGKDPQSLYEYDQNGVSPADKIIKAFNVPLSDLADNLQRAMGIKNGATEETPHVPAGMSIPDAIKKYGKGATVINSRGQRVTLPNE